MEAAGVLHTYSGVVRRRTIKSESVSVQKTGPVSLSKVKALAEGIILQAMDDLGDAGHRKESLQFFRGEGFGLWADIARLNLPQQIRLARLISGAARRTVKGSVA